MTKQNDETYPSEWTDSKGNSLAPELRQENRDLDAIRSLLDPEEQKKRYPSTNPHYYDNDNCGDDILNTDCHKGLKTIIWIMIAFSSLFILFFIFYVLSIIFASRSKTDVLQLQPKVTPVIQEEAVDVPVKSSDQSFFDRLFGSKPMPPPKEQKVGFFQRLFGKS